MFSQLKDTKHIRLDFLFCHLGHAPWVGLLGAGVPRGVNFFQHGHVAYQIDGDDEQIRMQVNLSF